MTLYRFDEHSLIDEVAVQHSGGSGVRAYVHAAEGADPQALVAIKNLLTQNEMKWTPMEHDGKPVIEVRSIGKNGEKLLQLLAANTFTAGIPQQQKNPENQVSLGTKFRNNTLRLSGLFYFLGDLGFLTYGWKDSFKKGKLKDPQNLLAGIFYAAGSPIITFFGRGDKSDMQLRHKSYNTLQFLQSNGVKIPDNSSILSVTYKHNSTLWRKIKSKMERYPAEITNSFFAIAGALVFWAGLRDGRELKTSTLPDAAKKVAKTRAQIDIATGISTMASGVISLVPEEPRKDGEQRSSGIAGVWQFVKEKPLRIAGALLGLSTAGHSAGSILGHKEATRVLNDPNATEEERKAAVQVKKGAWGRGLFAGTNLAAEGLMMASSKGHGEGVESDKSLEPSTYAVMADLIERSPAADREKVLDLVSSYLSKEEALHLPKEQIQAGILKQMEGTQKNPWLGVPQPALQAAEPAETAPSHEPSTAWRGLVGKPESAPDISGAITR